MASEGRRSFLGSFLGAIAGGCLLSAAPPLRAARSSPAALGYYAWAQREGRRLYRRAARPLALELQALHYRAQLEAITGGMGVDAFIAKSQRESTRLLREISAAIDNA